MRTKQAYQCFLVAKTRLTTRDNHLKQIVAHTVEKSCMFNNYAVQLQVFYLDAERKRWENVKRFAIQ